MAPPSDPRAKAPAPDRRVTRLTRWRDRDYTRGSLFVSMLFLSIPLMGSSLIGGVLFQVVDLVFITRLGEDAVTAVIVCNQSLRQIIFMLMMGASFGAQGLISRSVGSGDIDGAEHVAGQVVVLGLGVSCVFALLGGLFPRELLAAMQVAPEVLEVGIPYVRLTFLLNFGFVFLFLVNAILNGAGDAATPLGLTVVQTIASLAGEWLLIFGNVGFPELGIGGVAIGLAFGQAITGVLALRVLMRGSSRVHLRLHHFRPDFSVLRQILALSWPPGIQMLGQFLVSICFIRLMGELGEKAQTAYSIGLRISMMGPMIAFPLAGACATLVGQNLGAGNVNRAWRSIGVVITSNVAVLWSIAIALVAFRVPLMELLAEDPEVIRIGSEFLLFQAGAFGSWAFFFVFMRALQGAGDVKIPMMISLGVAMLVILPTGFGLARGLGWGPTGVFTATLVGSVLSTTLTGAWLATGRWSRRALAPPVAISGARDSS